MTLASSHGDHERFKELSALAHAGAIDSAELADLRAHLQFCGSCREVHDEYRALTGVGIPELAAIHSDVQEKTAWDATATRRKLFARIREEERVAKKWFPLSWLALGNRYTSFAGAAVAVCVALMVAGAYHVGRRMPSSTNPAIVAETRIQQLTAEEQSVQERFR